MMNSFDFIGQLLLFLGLLVSIIQVINRNRKHKQSVLILFGNLIMLLTVFQFNFLIFGIGMVLRVVGNHRFK